MDCVATLIAREDAGEACAPALRELVRALPARRGTRALDGERALEARFALERGGHSLESIAGLCKSVVGDLPIDVILLRAGRHGRKKLLIADMDSTMIGQECIDELAGFAGVKSQVAAITERAMRGDIAFEPALRERVALLRGLPASIVAEVIATRITLMPGARALVATMKAHGAFTALVSGGFDVFVEPVAAMIGFDASQANRLLVADGRFTGVVAEPVLGRAAKRAALRAHCAARGLSHGEAIAVGDGANDLDMLAAAGLGVAYRAKPAVAAAAHASIAHNDLTALLFAQGISRDEFAVAREA